MKRELQLKKLKFSSAIFHFSYQVNFQLKSHPYVTIVASLR